MATIKWTAKQKTLLLPTAGVALSFSRSAKNTLRIIETLPKAWKEIDLQNLYRTIRTFYRDRIIDYLEKDNDTVEIILTEEGRKRALKYKLNEIEIKKPARWDKKWRLVIFDIPEKKKKAREALRHKLRELSFYQLQKSVFVHPYECKDEIDFIIEVFELRPHVRLIRADYITNEAELRAKFKLY